MKGSVSQRALLTICCLVPLATGLAAQSTTQLFSDVVVQTSPAATSYTNPVTFNSTSVNLTCSAAITATLSGPVLNQETGALTPGGNLLVDNNILMSVTPAPPIASQIGAGPWNVCVGGFAQQVSNPLFDQNCFELSGYGVPASANSLNGDNPDTFIPGESGQTVAEAGGVPPIDISGYLGQGSQTVTIALKDEGGWFTNSSVYLTTSCTEGGVTGPALVTGNPIPPNPTPEELTQTFNFNTNIQGSQQIGFVYDLGGADKQNTLVTASLDDIPSPQVADLPLNPHTFRENFLFNTSFATSKCLIHTGELGPEGQAACKLYTLECTTPGNSVPSGAQCPLSTVANEVVKDVFDGPEFSLEDIHTRDGRTFHEGIGFLMASEGWGAESGVPPGTWNWDGGTGGPCTFDPAANLNLPCPQNLLTSFTGPGIYHGDGQTTHPNSAFISIAKVPEDHTHVRIGGGDRDDDGDDWGHWDHWIRSWTAQVKFHSEPPELRGTRLRGADKFIASPIQSITYGVSPEGNVPVPAGEPIAGDVTVVNSSLPNSTCPVPTAANPDPFPAHDFDVDQTLNFTSDGRYVLHYYAQDCAGTQELKFRKVGGSWTTNFYTREIDVDATPPGITPSALVLTGKTDSKGNYAVGEVVTVSFACSDATSGVVFCGGHFYWPGTNQTPTLTDRLDTWGKGKKTFKVYAVDVAGNTSEESVSYTVK